jgi:hypothetical protein
MNEESEGGVTEGTVSFGLVGRVKEGEITCCDYGG